MMMRVDQRAGRRLRMASSGQGRRCAYRRGAGEKRTARLPMSASATGMMGVKTAIVRPECHGTILPFCWFSPLDAGLWAGHKRFDTA
jgi:hypothetical protein